LLEKALEFLLGVIKSPAFLLGIAGGYVQLYRILHETSEILPITRPRRGRLFWFVRCIGLPLLGGFFAVLLNPLLPENQYQPLMWVGIGASALSLN